VSIPPRASAPLSLFGIIIAEPGLCRTLRTLRGIPYKSVLGRDSAGMTCQQLHFLTGIPEGTLKRILAPVGAGHGYWEDDQAHPSGYLPNIENAAKLAKALTSPALALWTLAQLVEELDQESEAAALRA
jgi:hypothetical protein